MTEQANETDMDLALKHKMFEELYDLIDTGLCELGVPDGIEPQPEESVRVEVPIPTDGAKCFYLGDNRLVKIEIAVSALRSGRMRGKKREEVTIDITGEAHKGEETTVFSRKIIFTAERGESYRDLWVDVPQLKRRWSIYRGFVKFELGGSFKDAPLEGGVDEAMEARLAYSLILTISEMIENFKNIWGDTMSDIEDILELL